MTALEIVRIPVLSDNYVWLVHDPDSQATMVVDPAVADPVLEAAAERGWTITDIWNTHWHPDHTGGNAGDQGSHRLHDHRSCGRIRAHPDARSAGHGRRHRVRSASMSPP